MYSVHLRTEVSNMNDEEEETTTSEPKSARLLTNRLSSLSSTSSTQLIEASGHHCHHLEKRSLGYLRGKTRSKNCLETSRKTCKNSTSDPYLLMKSTTTVIQIDKSLVMPAKEMPPDGKLIRGSAQINNGSPDRSPIFDHLIKLAMFLITIICSQTMRAVDCQAHHFASDTSKLRSLNEQLMLNQQLAFDQLVRNSNHYQHGHLVMPQRPVHRQVAVADRRVSATGATDNHHNHHHHQQSPKVRPGANQQQQQRPPNDGGKLLVCYYTTRQSAPYWPKDAREYVIPPEGFNSLSNRDLSQAAFAPVLHYEPFSPNAPAASDTGGPQQANNYATNQAGWDQSAQNTKNQQQQLVFKSAAVKLGSPAELTDGQQRTSPINTQTRQLDMVSSGSPRGETVTAAKQETGSATGNLMVDNQQPNGNQYHHNQQQQISSGALHVHQRPIDKSAGKQNKQSAAYSFVGEPFEGNNGLIVSDADSTSPLQQVLAGDSASGAQQIATINAPSAFINNGNNGNNNFVINHKDGHNQQQQQQQQVERSSMKRIEAQAQQLVFSPSLSRAFIVGGPGNSNNNNEAFDTKSQLYATVASNIQRHGGKPNTANGNNNNQFVNHIQQQASGSLVGSPLLYQHELGLLQRGKSLQQQQQLSAAEQQSQLSPAQNHVGFSGTVSNATPVPLSAASSSLVQTVSPYRGQLQQQAYSPSTNHLIVSNLPTTNAQKPSAPVGVNNLSTLKLQYSPNSVSGAVELSGAKAPLGAQVSAASSHAAPVPSLASSPASSLVGALPASGSSTSPGGGSPTSSGLQVPQTSAPVSGLSSALVSSPLSTMFDVFGAASQYLMRFKPSSLISPSSFSFNTISSDHIHHHHPQNLHHTHSGAKTDNASLLSAPSIATSSLVAPPFSSTGLMASLHKSSASSSASSANDRSGSGTSGILSRFSLQNNQRREDVCGKTIQTPQRRIIGGEGARYGEFPYQVHIKIAKHQCGGALVDKQSIVTAAHCVYHFITRAPVSKLQIVIGAYDIEDEQYQELPPQYFKVNKVKLHPNFRFSASHPDRYDIAILKLDKPVKYTDNVLPVCLPNRDLKFESMKVDVPIIENNECERWHRTRGIDLKIFPEMMCAGYEDGLKDACVGDSGGPLVVKTASGPNGSFRWTLAGITSAGFGCAQSRQPGIYHRVSHTVDWILDNLD